LAVEHTGFVNLHDDQIRLKQQAHFIASEELLEDITPASPICAQFNEHILIFFSSLLIGVGKNNLGVLLDFLLLRKRSES
jgi:hypothetical protein